MIKRRIAAALVTGTAMAATAGLAGTAQAASATPPASGAALLCTNAVDIGYTVRDGNRVKGSGSWTRCDSTFTRIDLYLFKQVTGSIYNQQAHINYDPADFGSHSYSIGQVCTGTGTKKWYTQIVARNAAGDSVISKTSNYLTVSC